MGTVAPEHPSVLHGSRQYAHGHGDARIRSLVPHALGQYRTRVRRHVPRLYREQITVYAQLIPPYKSHVELGYFRAGHGSPLVGV
eukprot:3931977-Rhodomonas_salina.1